MGSLTTSPQYFKIMAKLEISDWSELDLIESLVSDFLTNNGRNHRKYYTAKKLLDRVRPALMEATDEL